MVHLVKGEGNDWIVQTFLDLIKKQSGVNVFSAAHIDAGPVGQAVMDRTLPLGFHGSFVRNATNLPNELSINIHIVR
jgi:carotenoid cleavage dioxygenase-like enzyme